MDVLSLAASVWGLVALASGIVRFCYTYQTTMSEYKREIQAITSEVSELSGLLHALSPLIQSSIVTNNLEQHDHGYCDRHPII